MSTTTAANRLYRRFCRRRDIIQASFTPFILSELHSLLFSYFRSVSFAFKLVLIRETFERFNSISMFQIVGFLSKCSSSYCLGRFSLRDLLKWCKRITSLGFCFDGSLSKEQFDVFAAIPASFDSRLSIMKVIGNIWKERGSAAETLYPFDKPIYQDSVTGLKIGRVFLPYKKEPLHERTIPFLLKSIVLYLH
ncbi:midasin protein [Trifolium repens]|nr:midasin protein [Trifolium repens]